MSTDLTDFFAALADKTRLRLINLMRNGEVCVCFFAETLNTNNPKISRHLSYLKRAQLVAARRDGKWMHYRLTPPSNGPTAPIFNALLESLSRDPEMRADLEQMNDVCCQPKFVAIAGRTRG